MSVVRLTFLIEQVMNTSPRAQTIAAVLRNEIEAWRRAGNLSREAVAAMVIEAHQALGGEAATGVEFSFAGDTYTQAKKAAQKLYRWFDVEGTLPANVLPSILAALPLDVRMHCLNHILCPLGAEAAPAAAARPTDRDVPITGASLFYWGCYALVPLYNLAANAPDDQLLDAHKECVESAEASDNAARDLLARVTARQALAQFRDTGSK
jgi:hypothetical protein